MAIQLLMLEPDSDRRRLLADALRPTGAHVLQADGLKSAADSLQGGGFDAALLSLNIPELDVTALAAAICPSVPGSPVSLDAAERLHIARTLEHTAGNRRQAALILGISRSTLLHKIRKYRLEAVAVRTKRRGPR